MRLTELAVCALLEVLLACGICISFSSVTRAGKKNVDEAAYGIRILKTDFLLRKVIDEIEFDFTDDAIHAVEECMAKAASVAQKNGCEITGHELVKGSAGNVQAVIIKWRYEDEEFVCAESLRHIPIPLYR